LAKRRDKEKGRKIKGEKTEGKENPGTPSKNPGYGLL